MALNSTPARFVTLPSVYGSHEGNYWDRMVRDFSAALSECGLPCQPIDLSEPSRAGAFLSQPASEQPRVLLNFNLNSGLDVQTQGRTMPVVAAAACPTVNLLMDHPVHCFDAIWMMEREAAIRGASAPPRLYVPMDPLHVRSAALGGKPALPLPQGGPPAFPARRAFRERSIDVLSFGTLDVPSAANALPEALGLGARAADEAAAMTAAVLASTEDVETVVRNHLARIQPKIEMVPFVHAVRAIDARARASRRWALASSLADLPVVHFGNVSAQARECLPGWRFEGALSFDAICERMADATIVLSDTINLRNASLMRMFYAMAYGCTVATDMNAFLASEFADGKSIVALSLDDQNADKIRALLADPERLETIAKEGQAIHSARHTWLNRARTLVPHVLKMISDT